MYGQLCVYKMYVCSWIYDASQHEVDILITWALVYSNPMK